MMTNPMAPSGTVLALRGGSRPVALSRHECSTVARGIAAYRAGSSCTLRIRATSVYSLRLEIEPGCFAFAFRRSGGGAPINRDPDRVTQLGVLS